MVFIRFLGRTDLVTMAPFFSSGRGIITVLFNSPSYMQPSTVHDSKQLFKL